MNEKYTCHCGLYCENCAVKAKVEPAAKILHDEMKRAGVEDIIGMIPSGGEFWAFLQSMAENGTCASCREGSGNPGCAVRLCAQTRDIDMCALCKEYPCARFDELFAEYPTLVEDNELLRTEAMTAWAELQDSRKARGFTYSDVKKANHSI